MEQKYSGSYKRSSILQGDPNYRFPNANNSRHCMVFFVFDALSTREIFIHDLLNNVLSKYECLNDVPYNEMFQESLKAFYFAIEFLVSCGYVEFRPLRDLQAYSSWHLKHVILKSEPDYSEPDDRNRSVFLPSRHRIAQ